MVGAPGNDGGTVVATWRKDSWYKKMKFLPICINISDQRILIVGGGRLALEKLNSLKRYTSALTVLAPVVDNRIKELGIHVVNQEYCPELLEGVLLVYAASDKPKLNQQIVHDCRERKILVNVADCPSMCDFVSPAIYKSGDMSVAVSSNAKQVRKAIAWRNKIEAGAREGLFDDC